MTRYMSMLLLVHTLLDFVAIIRSGGCLFGKKRRAEVSNLCIALISVIRWEICQAQLACLSSRYFNKGFTCSMEKPITRPQHHFYFGVGLDLAFHHAIWCQPI